MLRNSLLILWTTRAMNPPRGFARRDDDDEYDEKIEGEPILYEPCLECDEWPDVEEMVDRFEGPREKIEGAREDACEEREEREDERLCLCLCLCLWLRLSLEREERCELELRGRDEGAKG